MKIKFVAISIMFILGILLASCGASSKYCPAYSDASTDSHTEVSN